jgi:hypothetical protein
MSLHLFPSRLAALACAIFCASVFAADDVARTGGPYVPTPQVVVDAMLDFAKVGPRDFVVDLGSGDGRIVLTAADRYSARGFGVEIDPELVELSNAEAAKRGFAERVSFRQQDVLLAKIDQASVVTLYLLPGMMQQLQAKFTSELKPGTRIVSHDFPFGDWKPDREITIDVPEKYGSPGNWKSTLFYWIVPARVQGTWTLSAPGLAAASLPLVLEQKYQFVESAAANKAKRATLSGGRLEGDRISFRLGLPGGAYEFSGVVEGDRMRGEATQGARVIPWTAARAAP